MSLNLIDWKPTKPQCIHKNDADDCLLCGTKRILERKPELERSTPIIALPCEAHRLVNCMFCRWLAEEAVKRLRNELSLKAAAKAVWDEVRQQEHEARWPGGKCEHGHYLATEYCNVCRLRAIEPNYDPDKYRKAINTALKGLRAGFRGAEGKKDWQDLNRVIDLKIWQACRKYGDGMNEALAYTIAKNTANTFLRDLINETTILNGVAWEFMQPEFKEQAEDLFARLGQDLRKLESAAHNHESKDYALAKQIVEDFGQRVPRSESMTPSATDDNDDHQPQSAAEVNASMVPIDAAPSAEDIIEAHRPALEALVGTWRGDQRKVGEAMLRPGFKVTGVPGIDKSKVSRIRQVVLKAFRNHIQTQGLQNS